jgi:hypothetical protein
MWRHLATERIHGNPAPKPATDEDVAAAEATAIEHANEHKAAKKATKPGQTKDTHSAP